MKQRHFRQSAIEHLNSPERLDEVIQVVQARSWILMGLQALLIIFLSGWAFLGSVPVIVKANAVQVGAPGVDAVACLPPGLSLILEPGLPVRLSPVDGSRPALEGRTLPVSSARNWKDLCARIGLDSSSQTPIALSQNPGGGMILPSSIGTIYVAHVILRHEPPIRWFLPGEFR